MLTIEHKSRLEAAITEIRRVADESLVLFDINARATEVTNYGDEVGEIQWQAKRAMEDSCNESREYWQLQLVADMLNEVVKG